MSERALLDKITAGLRAAGIPDAGRDARKLWDYAYAIGQEDKAQDRDRPNDLTLEILEIALADRLLRKPVSQIIGHRAFWKHEFLVTSDVLDPRPETEMLVELALSGPFSSVLDIGTGSGCILLSLLAERTRATGLGVDLSEAALKIARRNAARLNIDAGFAQSDWFSNVQGGYDLIVSNPPYIAADEMAGLAPEVRDWEPEMALTPGGDGLAAYRVIAAGAAAHLTCGGRLLVEIGPTQGAAVAELFRAAGLENITLHPDLDGRDRVVSADAAARGK